MVRGVPSLPIRDERVRRIAVAAAKGGGGLLGVGTALAGAGIGALVVQARQARREIGPRTTVPPYADGRYLPVHANMVLPPHVPKVTRGDEGPTDLPVERAS